MTGRVAPFDPHPSTEAGYQAARRHLRRAFSRWSDASGSPFGPDSFEALVHYKWGYMDGHLTRWHCADLSEVLLELFPAKVIVDDDEMPDVVPEAQAFVTFLADTGLLDPASDDPGHLRVHLEKIERRFVRRMSDRSRYSSWKRFWLSAAEAGVDVGDEQAVAAYIERFNTLPEAERRAITGRSRGAAQRQSRFTSSGGVQLPRSAIGRARQR